MSSGGGVTLPPSVRVVNNHAHVVHVNKLNVKYFNKGVKSRKMYYLAQLFFIIFHLCSDRTVCLWSCVRM